MIAALWELVWSRRAIFSFSLMIFARWGARELHERSFSGECLSSALVREVVTVSIKVVEDIDCLQH